MAYVIPTVADFKSRFDRDFPFCGSDQTDFSKVRDVDVTRAFTSVTLNFNPNLFNSQASFTEAYLLLTAHYLVTALNAAAQGVRGAGEWLTNSKSVGQVMESFTIPDRILKSPFLAAISKTTYGMQYIAMIAPLLVGNVSLVVGDTTP
jgi:hypothetical protein